VTTDRVNDLPDVADVEASGSSILRRKLDSSFLRESRISGGCWPEEAVQDIADGI
jgi:hypothetical protein